MTRLPPLDVDALDAEQRRVYDALASGPRGGVRGPFPALLQRPVLAERVADLGEALRFDSTFSRPLFQTIVIVTARAARCALVWHTHSRIAAEVGVAPEVIEAIRVGGEPSFDEPDQRLVHDFARALANEHRVADPVYEAALARFGPVGVVELAAVVGYFLMIATTINAHELRISPDPGDPFDV